MTEILDGREWTGAVRSACRPARTAASRRPASPRSHAMPTTTESGERAAVCIVSSTCGPCAALSRPTSLPLRQFSANLPSASCCSTPISRSADQPHVHLGVRRPGRRPRAATPSTTTCRATGRTGCRARCVGSWRPATPSPTCSSSGPRPARAERRLLVHRPLSRAQRFSGPADRHRRPRHGRDAPARRRPRGRAAPAAASRALNEAGARIGTPSTWRLTARAPRRRRPRLLRPGLRRPVPGPARR